MAECLNCSHPSEIHDDEAGCLFGVADCLCSLSPAIAETYGRTTDAVGTPYPADHPNYPTDYGPNWP